MKIKKAWLELTLLPLPPRGFRSIVALLFFGCEQYPLPPSPKCHGNCSKCRFSRETPYVAMCNVILHKLAEVSVKGNIPWHVGPDSWISHAPPRCFLMFGLLTPLPSVIKLPSLPFLSPFFLSSHRENTHKVDSFFLLLCLVSHLIVHKKKSIYYIYIRVYIYIYIYTHIYIYLETIDNWYIRYP